MKKITLLILLTFFSIVGYSQFTPVTVEGFKSTAGPDALPSTNWTLGTGNWAVFDNTVGTTRRWGINTTVATPPIVYQGTNAAYVDRENLGTEGLISEDYLSTPLVSIPANGQLRFYTRSFTSGNQGTLYQIRVAPATASQTNPAAYTLVQQWDETTLNTTFNIYEEKVVDLSAYATQQVYVSFVRVHTQLPGGINGAGDRWLVDDVTIVQRCLDPTTLTFSTITHNSATLNWANPSGATSWEIEIVPATGTPTGVGTIYNGPLPYVASGLLANTAYKFYVRAICNTGYSSLWVGPSTTFTTQVAPPECGGNFVDAGGITANYANNSNITTTICPVNSGDVVTVTFTAFNTQAGSDILTVYNGNDNTGTVLGTFSGTTIPPSITSSATNGCLTFVFTSNATVTAAGWISNITCGPPPACPSPIALSTTALLSTSVSFGWTNVAPATSWEVLALPCGSPAPTAATTGWTAAPTNPHLFTGLTSATCYDLYVRGNCSSTSNGVSLWSGPKTVTTQVAPPECGGNFVDAGGTTANYANNSNITTTICPVNSGDVVTVTFTAFNTQAGSDILTVYNGNDNTGTVLGTFSGTTIPPSITSSATNGCLTFVFTSNATVTAAGWISNITCGPPPACPSPIALSTTALLSTSVSFGWTNVAPATSWEVLALPCGSPAPTAATTGWTAAPTNPHLFTGLTSATCYDLYVRGNCSSTSNGVSLWSGPTTVTTQVAPPECGGNFVDAGGTTANYANSSNITTTICPTNPGEVVTVTFTSFNTEPNFDGLYVYDGNNVIPANLLASANPAANVPGGLAGSYWGTTIPGPFTSSAADGCLTFVFRSDGSVNRAGWVANITCGPPPACQQPTALVSSAVTSNSATLAWTNVGLATSWEVLALPCGSPAPTAATTGWTAAPANPHIFTGLASATCFDLYVRGNCGSTSNGVSLWSGPRTVTTQVAPPVCGGNFVDAAGPTTNYANNSNATTTICPTNPGEVVTVTFTSFDTEPNFDGLYVYDGNAVISANLMASANPAANVPGGIAGSYWGTTIPGPFTSSTVDGCLTFVFRSDGSVNRAGWIANVTCAPAPNCLKPITLTATSITSTSASLGWTETNSAVIQWEVLVLPLGSPVPLPTATGTIVSTNPALFTGLTPGTQYTFYVRGLCPTSGTSVWSNGFNFNTLLANDECSGATFAPVNSSAVCQQVTPGSIAGATASTPTPLAPCIGTADDDVWFQFIATNPYLNVALQNVTGTTTNLNFAAYSGQCGTLTQIFCSTANALSGVLNNLTIGQTYYIRVYSNANTPQASTFNLCISTPSTCPTASTVCSLTNYANTTGVTSLGTIGCLNTSPNPAYFTIQVATSGPINFLLTQSTTPGGAPNIDVDYAAWGPYSNQASACAAIGSPLPTLPPGIGVPVTQQTGCSYSAASTENLNITNAVAGQFYIVLITNFSNQAGFINLTQTNAGAPGAGTTLCCQDAYFSYSPVSYCKDPGTPNPIAIIATGSVAGVFSSTITPGLVFANTATGEIDLQASAPGNYVITNTVAPTISCTEKVKSFTINITAPTSATIAYGATSYCKSINALQSVIQTGSTGGTYSASPNGGLFIDANTGSINPSLSSPGVYTVTYSLLGSGVCVLSNPTTQVEIIALPNIVQPAPVSVCNSYTLPVLTVGNYYSQSGGLGTPLDINVPITSSQMIYIYAENNGCSNEKSFNVSIGIAPTPTLNVTQTTCAIQTGTIEVTSPLGTGSGLPTNLFISEVTDEDVGSLTYVEIYNGTGSSVDLSNYKLKVYNNGSTTASCDNQLTGILNNNATFVVAVGSVTNQGGVTPNQVFDLCGGVNTDDNIRLTTSTDVEIDNWGRTDGVAYTPSNQAGYTYRRNNTATVPSLTWNTSDWTAIDPQDYTNIGSYTMLVTGYQYSLDNGTYQSGTIFNTVVPGNHTITVLDLASGCLSVPVDVIINPVPVTPTVLTFSYSTPVCQNATTNPLPITATGFTTGGVFSSTAGLNINGQTGEISLTSTPGTYTVTYTVTPIPSICLDGGSSTFEIVINPVITPVTTFSYTSPACFGEANPLPNTSATGFTFGGVYSSTTGLNINSQTGEISLPSTPGTYTVTYTVGADVSTCQIAGSSTAQIVISVPIEISVAGDCEGNNFVLTASPVNNSFDPNTVSYVWEGSQGNNVGSTQSVIVTNPDTYTVQITSNGCTNSSEIIVDAITCVIQKGISVNGDGKNDTFDLTGFNVKNLSIFNRYGNKVYSFNNYTNQWGGKSDNGDELPDGTYYYVINRDNGETKTGWIYINRAQ